MHKIGLEIMCSVLVRTKIKETEIHNPIVSTFLNVLFRFEIFTQYQIGNELRIANSLQFNALNHDVQQFNCS